MVTATEISFTFQLKEGVAPPLIGVAVKITSDPSQTLFAEGVMATPTATLFKTLTFIDPDPVAPSYVTDTVFGPEVAQETVIA